MITKTLDGINYDMGRDTNDLERDILSHCAVAFGFLLNTPERRNKAHTWAELADLMADYSTNLTVGFLARRLKQISQKVNK